MYDEAEGHLCPFLWRFPLLSFLVTYCRQNSRYAYYMIALILRFCLPKGEEILHIQSVLCRKYLFETRFISLQMR